jgi:hypothetical protein
MRYDTCDYCGCENVVEGRCNVCGHGIRFNVRTAFAHEGMESLSLDDGGAAEREQRLEAADPWDSAIENAITESLKPSWMRDEY